MKTSKLGGGFVAFLLCAACSGDEQEGSTSTGAAGPSGAGGGTAGSGATSTGGAGGSGTSTGGASDGGSAGAGGAIDQGGNGVGGAPVTGCADGGTKCPRGQMCCTGVPYPPEGACYKQCDLDSDRAIKEGFQSVDPDAVLERLASLEVTQWSYTRDGSAVRHMGPTAQDFREAFGLGTDAEHIHTIDGQGVTIAAVQALNERMRQLQRENDALRRAQETLEQRLRELERAR